MPEKKGAGSFDWQGNVITQLCLNEFKIKVTCRYQLAQWLFSSTRADCPHRVTSIPLVRGWEGQTCPQLVSYQPQGRSADQKAVGSGGCRSAGGGALKRDFALGEAHGFVSSLL